MNVVHVAVDDAPVAYAEERTEAHGAAFLRGGFTRTRGTRSGACSPTTSSRYLARSRRVEAGLRGTGLPAADNGKAEAVSS